MGFGKTEHWYWEHNPAWAIVLRTSYGLTFQTVLVWAQSLIIFNVLLVLWALKKEGMRDLGLNYFISEELGRQLKIQSLQKSPLYLRWSK